jgi:hypothetical protein
MNSLKLRAYPEKGNNTLFFNRLKFNMVAGYNGCAGTDSGRHEYRIGKRHFTGSFEKGGFTDNVRAQSFNKGYGESIVCVMNNGICMFRANRPYTIIIDLNKIGGVHDKSHFIVSCLIEKSSDNYGSFFTIKEGKYRASVKYVFLHGGHVPLLAVFLFQAHVPCPRENVPKNPLPNRPVWLRTVAATEFSSLLRSD